MIQLSDHFDYKRLLRFTLPSIVMMIFTSIYSVVDGFFVSNFAGKTPFAAVNFIFPVLMILGCVGFMFGTGGSALIAKTMGEGEREKANDIFSLLVYVGAGCGVVLAAAGIALMPQLAALLGAEGELLANSVVYGRIVLCALPFFTLQMEFQCLFATAEKPGLGLSVTVAAGVTNMVLDALFVGVLRWGLEGAAAATAVSQLVGGVAPLIYFGRRNDSPLRLGRCRLDGRVLFKACTNGASELMSNISASVGGMYIVGYHYGADNRDELKNLLRRSAILIGGFSVLMCLAGETLGRPLSMLFVGYDPGLLDMTAHAFSIFSIAFLFSGFAIFGSSFFTALNDGLTSALISFLRTLVFQCAAVVLFSVLWGLDGIWWSIVAAEIMAVAVTLCFMVGKRKQYGYF